MTSARRTKEAFALAVVVVLLQGALQTIGAVAATKQPFFTIVQNKSGIPAITLDFGTKYAGKTITVTAIVQLGTKKVNKVIGNVTIGKDGKGVLISKVKLAKGDQVITKFGGKPVASAVIKNIQVLSKLPKATNYPSLCDKTGEASYPPKAKC